MKLIGTPRLYTRERFGLLRVIVPLLVPSKKSATYWTHPGCGTHHRRPDTAAKCAAGSRGPLTRHN